MASYKLPPEQVAHLRRVHKQTQNRAFADRIKAVVLLSEGWDAVKIAEALLIDERTVRQYFYTYKRLGIDGLMFNSRHGRESYLNSETLADLTQYVKEVASATIKEVDSYVYHKHFISGTTKLLRV